MKTVAVTIAASPAKFDARSSKSYSGIHPIANVSSSAAMKSIASFALPLHSISSANRHASCSNSFFLAIRFLSQPSAGQAEIWIEHETDERSEHFTHLSLGVKWKLERSKRSRRLPSNWRAMQRRSKISRHPSVHAKNRAHHVILHGQTTSVTASKRARWWIQSLTRHKKKKDRWIVCNTLSHWGFPFGFGDYSCTFLQAWFVMLFSLLFIPSL